MTATSSGTSAGTTGTGGEDESGESTDDTDDTGDPSEPFVPGQQVLPRLTPRQYRNAVGDLFSGGPLPNVELEPDTNPYLFVSIGATSTSLSELGAQQYEEAANTLTLALWDDGARRDALLGCTPATADDACGQGFLANFGRPLTSAQASCFRCSASTSRRISRASSRVSRPTPRYPRRLRARRQLLDRPCHVAARARPAHCGVGLSACGVLCVEHQTDPANCGSCGITCVVPNSQSSCVAGNCSLGDCDVGWFDCDGAAANGCEAQPGCAGGESCTTECGSTGLTACNGCDMVCESPAETCNAIDDDCNGSCDEGAMAGCRQGVHRSVGPNGHYYTNVLAETSQAGRTLEFADYWWMYAAQEDGLTALYRCDIGGATRS